MQDMLQNKTQVETVNFRLYFKVIIGTAPKDRNDFASIQNASVNGP